MRLTIFNVECIRGFSCIIYELKRTLKMSRAFVYKGGKGDHQQLCVREGGLRTSLLSNKCYYITIVMV